MGTRVREESRRGTYVEEVVDAGRRRLRVVVLGKPTNLRGGMYSSSTCVLETIREWAGNC